MMIFDANAYLGNWFARQIRHGTAAELVALMDENNIDKACVGSLSAIMYRNSQRGNEELTGEIDGFTDRLVPFAVINPAYADWEYDLDWCLNEMGAKGVRAYPQYHDYAVGDAVTHEMCDACTERGVPVVFIQRQVDYRQSHWMVDAPDLVLNDIAALCADHPDTNFIILNGLGFAGSRFVTEAEDLPANSYIEISRSSVFMAKEMKVLIDTLGPERVLFGTGIPMKYPGPALLKMEHVETSDENKAIIWGQNLQGLLGV
jgi:predicted TIM-barrel fold metal-dependent hydrolase